MKITIYTYSYRIIRKVTCDTMNIFKIKTRKIHIVKKRTKYIKQNTVWYYYSSTGSARRRLLHRPNELVNTYLYKQTSSNFRPDLTLYCENRYENKTYIDKKQKCLVRNLILRNTVKA